MLKSNGIWILALTFWAGCAGVEDSGNNPPPQKDDPPADRLLGVWEFRSADVEEGKRYLFGNDDSFQYISVHASDTSVYEGLYSVIDSMAHIVIQKEGKPTEEIWLRFSIREDSMAMYKGIALNGASETLVGEWKTVAAVPDSMGGYRVYDYVFTADGILLMSNPSHVDTSGYLADGSVIQVRDKSTGKVKMTLDYEITDGRLSLYNRNTEALLFRIR